MRALVLLLATFLAATAVAQSAAPAAALPAASQSVKDLLYNDEQKLGAAEQKKNTAIFEQLLAPDFRQVMFNGMNLTRDQVLKDMKYIDVSHYVIKNVNYRALGPDAALLTYDLDIQASAAGKSAPSREYACSIWQRRGGRWMLVFHQTTPAGHQ